MQIYLGDKDVWILMVGKGNIIFDIGEESCPWGGSLSILKQAKKWKYPVAVAKLEKICYN